MGSSAKSGAPSLRQKPGAGSPSQMPDEQKMALCDYVLANDGAVTELEWQVEQLWPILRLAAR